MPSDVELINLEFALSQLSGNQDLLLKLLSRFSEENQHLDDEIRAALSAGDSRGLKIKVHTVKGVCSNLGLDAITWSAKFVEQQLKADGELEQAVAQFCQSVVATLDHIAQLQQRPELLNISAETVSNCRSELADYIHNNRYIPADYLATLLHNLNCADRIKRDLHNAIDTLDYPTASRLLADIQSDSD